MCPQKRTARLKQAGLDAEAHFAAAEAQAVLTGEIHHRMKNMIAMITAIVRQSMRACADMAQAEHAITTRLQAMSRAHDLLLRPDRKSASLAEVIQGAIEQHDTAEGRFLLEGYDLQIHSAGIVPLALALNELCTNAIKYGALSLPAGLVSISWSVDQAHFTLRWAESGGPAVVAPVRNSFGTRLIEQALPRQLGGTGHMAFAPAGVAFELVVPRDRLLPQQVLPKEVVVHA